MKQEPLVLKTQISLHLILPHLKFVNRLGEELTDIKTTRGAFVTTEVARCNGFILTLPDNDPWFVKKIEFPTLDYSLTSDDLALVTIHYFVQNIDKPICDNPHQIPVIQKNN